MTNITSASANVPDTSLIADSSLYSEGGVLRVGALDRFPGLLHAISTRTAPDGEDWNLSARRGTPENPPHPATALRNREKLAALLGIELDSMVGVRQVHGTLVVRVGREHAGRGMRPEMPPIEDADGMVTDVPGLYMLALSADCPPVFLYDPAREVAGLVHSGWKGTVGGIAANTVTLMVDDFGSDPGDMVAVVGPGIGPCCYDVGENVVQAVEAAFASPWEGENPLLQHRDNKVYFDLQEGIRRSLLASGVRPENITIERACTSHNRHLFYSHRGDAGQCGLFSAVLGIRD
jgi:polyphenol oxidase